MDRIKLFKKVTGDTDTGKAPMWLEKKYFEFCKDSNIEACYHVLKNGHKMAMIQPEHQRQFDEWLFENYGDGN